MPTLLVKNVSDELMKKLRRLKVEMNCKTWAELLEKLIELKSRELVFIGEDDLENMRRAIDEFLDLRDIVTRMWGEGSVLEEFRKARGHVK